MALPPAPAPFTDADYELIAAAVLETARGRWFLSEHARRNRHADTRLVLDAIEKLERSLAHRASSAEADRLRLDLVEMMNAITRTKSEIAAIKPSGNGGGRFDHASSELDAIVEATERATSTILSAAENVQEIAWRMREQGIDGTICDLVDSHATEIFTACSFQDLTGQRIRKVIQVLRFLEARIDTMIKIWRLDDLQFAGSPVAEPDGELRGPARPGEGLEQRAIDELLGVERNEDVTWREIRPETAGTGLNSFDLDDIEVFERKPDPPSESPPSAPPSSVPAPKSTNGGAKPQPARTDSAKDQGLNALSLADRLALFS